ncbi:MFS transporter [Luteipulveratus sp. YIM 133132]|uniref:MFS transporter n=1 Tax=Luteipulveratus flavus TaxID=3031728 RepID=UPI0023B003B3|nr:MFS transporter [Luteipulveratus sp. YIM 133132]MDE9365042.1 MFS transporter [Luteipulveratus sp. YIM 133132]
MTSSTTTAPPPAPVRPATRTGLLLAVVLGAQFMAVLDASIVNVAIPSMHADLGADGAGLQLVLAGYVISYAVLLVTGARLGDRLGQRTMFVAGLSVFSAASLACGLAWSTEALIAFRFVQGAGAAMMVPQVMTLIQVTFAGEARGRALSLYAAVISGGAVVGQVLGGLIVSSDVAGTQWRGVFLVNVPIGLLLLGLARRILPAGSARPGHRLDLKGLALLTPTVLLLVVPLVLGHEEDWPLWGWVMLAASAVLLAAFVAVERRVEASGGAALFPGRVLRARGLVPAAAGQFLVMSTFSASLFTMAIHLQSALGYTALHAGLLFIPMAGCFAVASMTWRRVPVRHHARMIPAGLVLAAASLVAMGVLLRDGRGFGVAALVVFGVMGLGFGAAFSPLMAVALGRVPLVEAADASGFVTTLVQLGNVVGVATFGTLYLTRADDGVRHASAEAIEVTDLAQAGAIVVAACLAWLATRPAPAPAAVPDPV